MDDAVFFSLVKHTVFGGHMSQGQVDGINNILDYAETHYPKLLRNQLSNIFGQCTWETEHKMQPISEDGGPRYLRNKPYWPWYGRGLIQITWQENYAKFDITSPDDALSWPRALDIMFRGMVDGMFSGHKLADYCNATVTDFYNARRVVNKLDRAQECAALSVSYLKAFEAAGYNPLSV